MKPSFDFKKGKEALNNALQKTADASKKVAVGVKDGTKTLVEKAKVGVHDWRMKKYNPLFPEKFNSESFNIPNMIIIVDDAVRREIDVCDGAIGWLNNDKGIEILYLYDEAVEMSKIKFVPCAECDAAYYVDSFDRNRFIRLDCIFSKAHEEKMAELKHIAHSLGAKKCIIEINESSKSVAVTNTSASVSGSGLKSGERYETNEQIQMDSSVKHSAQRSGMIEIEFSGNDTPVYPTLKWFAHDDNIKRLIEMRVGNTNSIKNETLIIKGSMCSAMSQKTAYVIDNAFTQMSANVHYNMESQAQKENSSDLVFKVEF